MKNKKNPCPFCGKDDVTYEYTEDQDSTGLIFTAWRAYCVNCGAAGPKANSEKLAYEKWEKRNEN